MSLKFYQRKEKGNQKGRANNPPPTGARTKSKTKGRFLPKKLEYFHLPILLFVRVAVNAALISLDI